MAIMLTNVNFDAARNVLNRNFSNGWKRNALRFQMLKTRRIACVNGKLQRAFNYLWDFGKMYLQQIMRGACSAKTTKGEFIHPV